MSRGLAGWLAGWHGTGTDDVGWRLPCRWHPALPAPLGALRSLHCLNHQQQQWAAAGPVIDGSVQLAVFAGCVGSLEDLASLNVMVCSHLVAISGPPPTLTVNTILATPPSSLCTSSLPLCQDVQDGTAGVAPGSVVLQLPVASALMQGSGAAELEYYLASLMLPGSRRRTLQIGGLAGSMVSSSSTFNSTAVTCTCSWAACSPSASCCKSW
ncbi:hypothetical protein Agub_g13997 [Astrephomene gubernaculifera]|uniref:Uncharacterized protein n=1 Tax=Astrephomene gubernaculifera TaxID=47775 RepID=A0AAD3HSR7_9CHLO|nr:hypothetical protein Agub_g13997 [Astrephomene gubernaculifera]